MKRKFMLTIVTTTLLLASCGQPASTPIPAFTTAPTTTGQELADAPRATDISEQAQAQEGYVPTFEEATCPFDLPADQVEGETVQCGYVVVPEDHGVPDGPAIRLAVVFRKDRSEAHQPDPVFVLSGGPGEKIVANAPVMAEILAPIHPNRDLIIFDQRGVGLSEPALECPEFVQARLNLLDETDPNIVMQATFEAVMACRDRLVKEGHNLAAYNTIQSAADVNAIRIALGYDQVNLFGGSYGSMLAQAIMRDHPEGIRSVVMNSVLPLEKSIFIDTSVVAANAVTNLLDSCAKDEACNSAYPDLQVVLFDVIDRLNAEPAAITVTNPLSAQSYDAMLTGEAVFGNLVVFLYQTQIIPIMPQAIYEVNNGDYELMAQLVSRNLALFDAVSRGMAFSVICTEDLIDRKSEDLLSVRAQLPEQLVSSADPAVMIEYGIFGICENWPAKEAEPWVKLPLVSDIPTLVLEGEFDPVTPIEYGQLVVERLSNGYIFEFPGVGHNIMVANECARSLAGAFLEDPTRAPDAACVAEMPDVAFDVPGEIAELALEPFSDDERGFSGLVPAGWTELSPANLARRDSALDPTYFVIAAEPRTADEMFTELARQLEIDPKMESVAHVEIGYFIWDFYRFERPGGYMADLALAADDNKAYFIYLVATLDEHDALYKQLFMPAVEAMAPLE